MNGAFGSASKVVDESNAFAADELRPHRCRNVLGLGIGDGGCADLHGNQVLDEAGGRAMLPVDRRAVEADYIGVGAERRESGEDGGGISGSWDEKSMSEYKLKKTLLTTSTKKKWTSFSVLVF